MYVILALAAALALGGCTTARADAVDLTVPGSPDRGVPYEGVPHEGPDTTAMRGDTARVALGEAVAVDGVEVRFARVAEDSRCPPDVSCVWAGRAHVELVVGGETHVLSVPGYGPDDMPAEATAGGLTVRVTALAGPAASAASEPLAMWVEIVAERS